MSDFCSADMVLLRLATQVLLLLKGGLPLILPSYLCLLWFKGLSESDSSSHLRLDDDDEELKENDRCGVVVAEKDKADILNDDKVNEGRFELVTLKFKKTRHVGS